MLIAVRKWCGLRLLILVLFSGFLLAGCAQPRRPVMTAVETGMAANRIEAKFVVGRSVEGRPIKLYVFGQRESFDDNLKTKTGVQTVFILGGTHGSEPTSASVARDLVDYLKRHPEVYRKRYVAIMPEVNPDGLAAGTRINSHKIDLNRNFPSANWIRTKNNNCFSGEKPASEPEVQAELAVLESLKPVRILTIHSIRRGRHGNNYDGPACYLARLMAAKNGYPVLKTMGYPTPGSLGSWAGLERHIPIVTLELPREQAAEASWNENREALLAFIRGGGDDE